VVRVESGGKRLIRLLGGAAEGYGGWLSGSDKGSSESPLPTRLDVGEQGSDKSIYCYSTQHSTQHTDTDTDTDTDTHDTANSSHRPRLTLAFS
jgi:hypothetical protein